MAFSSRPHLSIFFPLYNEERNLPGLVEACERFIAGYPEPVEVILVNDGSTDGSDAVIAELAREHPWVRSVTHPRNRGYGAALRSGFEASRGELIFFSDGDRQFTLAELPEFIRGIERGADAVIGYRFDRRDPFMRKVNAWCWSRLVRLVFGLAVRDIDCGYKIFTRETVESLELNATGALISTEMLVKIVKSGRKLTEAPVRHFERGAGRQTGASLRVIAWAFFELLKLHRRIKATSDGDRWKREQRHFDAAAVSERVFVATPEFDLLTHPCVPEHEALVRLFDGNFRGLRVLDIGCGVGEASIAFAQRDATVTGVDVSPVAVERARAETRRLGLDVDLRTVAGYALPFETGTFDLVYGNGVLHHLELRRSLPEIKRVLRPGGYGYFIEPSTGNPLIGVYRRLARDKRSVDERPLDRAALRAIRAEFPLARVEPSQVCTLAVFLKMFLVEWKSPNRVSYWRQPILEHERYRHLYAVGGRADETLRRRFPRLFTRLAWNLVIVLPKA